ncbi:RNA polymerase sigma-70 factor [Nocardia cyriacigeorgica]|nr:RNA polymerase sigma-70 factor [Nocardia cyriacigeorgica]
MRQPGSAQRRAPTRPQGRHPGEGLHRRPPRSGDQGADRRARGVEGSPRGPQARFAEVAEGRCQARASGRGTGSHVAVTADEHAERFTLLRPLLFTIAYEVLGSAIEADDVLQDSYLRWADVDLATVRDTKSYLARLVTRQSLNALRASVRRREDYVGPWLPEPVLLDENDAAADVVLAESVSMAMLVILETLTPDERVVFVLREVFGFSHHDIASAVGKSVPTVRQAVHRARKHVQARRRRFEPADTATAARITQQFMAAAMTGDMDGLLALLAKDATLIADGGGKAAAARHPVVGGQTVAARLVNLFHRGRALPSLRIETAHCNGAPALVAYRGDRLEGVFLFEITDDEITNIYAIRNPDKLLSVTVPRRLSRQREPGLTAGQAADDTRTGLTTPHHESM